MNAIPVEENILSEHIQTHKHTHTRKKKKHINKNIQTKTL